MVDILVPLRWVILPLRNGSILVDYMSQPAQDGIYQAEELGLQMSAAEGINDLKNHSLYVSQIGNGFFKPSELIDLQSATACVSDARKLFQIIQMAYSVWSSLTGLTEEGLRSCVETPLFQSLYQALGSAADLSHFPTFEKQQAMEEMVAVLNSPFLHSWMVQFPGAVEELLQSLDQAENQEVSQAEDAESKEPVSQEGSDEPPLNDSF